MASLFAKRSELESGLEAILNGNMWIVLGGRMRLTLVLEKLAGNLHFEETQVSFPGMRKALPANEDWEGREQTLAECGL